MHTRKTYIIYPPNYKPLEDEYEVRYSRLQAWKAALRMGSGASVSVDTCWHPAKHTRWTSSRLDTLWVLGEPMREMMEAGGAIMTSPLKEAGPWSAGVVESDGRAYIESSDFTYDARLYVNGDFEDAAQKLEYAQEIARRLNAWQAHCLKLGG